MIEKILLLASVISIFTVLMLHAAECTIQEENRIIKTYPFSDPDPVPVLVRNPTIYPYHRFEQFSTTGQDQTWKVIRLENPYLKVFVLPEVGGKIYGAIEKTTGREFVYLNDVLKFRQIALRGPWTSGGIEFNFGIVGHAPSSASPVDYQLRENPDGSVSCVIGDLDLPSRTRWSVRITLPKDKAFIETQSLWFNPSPLHQSYYVWQNDAIKVGDDLQYFYPGKYVVPHSYDNPLEPYPVDAKARDISWYKNNNFGGDKSHFILGEYEHFYGGYWHADEFGFGHWALYDDMPGRKMWLWSLSRQGGIWEKLLTDTDGQYSEPQAGRLFSQVDHEFFTPYTGDTWRELWFSFKEIGGLVQSSPRAALNVVAQNGRIKIGICALAEFADELVVTAAGKTLRREPVKLQPMQLFQTEIAFESDAFFEVRLGADLKYSSNPAANDLQRPIHYHLPDESTPEGLYLSGEFQEKQRQFAPAKTKYEACLQAEPQHTRAMVRLAELHLRRAEYVTALEYATRALKISMYDPDANYVYGVAARNLGQWVDAKETFGWAARSLKYRSNAGCQMAEIYVIEQNFALAVEYARRALDFNKFNLRAYEVLALAQRLQNDFPTARQTLANLEAIDPLNHFIRFERFLMDQTTANQTAFQQLIRNELPHETYLELAISYASLGLENEAVTLLQLAPAHPTVHFWLGYLLRNSQPEQSAQHRATGLKLSPRLVFPFRPETIPVLEWAIETAPEAWQPKYYLGLLLWGLNRTDETRKLFATCGQPDFAPFYLTRGSLVKTENPAQTRADFEQALQRDPNDWRNWHYLLDFLADKQEHAVSLNLAEKAFRKFNGAMVPGMDYASALFYNQQFSACLKILEKIELLPYEGAWEGHHLFVQANLKLALQKMQEKNWRRAIQYLAEAKTYPEHLGTGEPFDPDFRLQDFLIAHCETKLGNNARAEALQQGISEYTRQHRLEWGNHHFWGALVLRELGQPEQAESLLRAWTESQPQNLLAQWCLAKFRGEAAEETTRQLKPNSAFQMLQEIVSLVEKH